MNSTACELWNHIVECLGIQDRKLTKLVLTFDIDDEVRIETEEIIVTAKSGIKREHKTWELKEVDEPTPSP